MEVLLAVALLSQQFGLMGQQVLLLLEILERLIVDFSLMLLKLFMELQMDILIVLVLSFPWIVEQDI
jgi:hypothetical protein